VKSVAEECVKVKSHDRSERKFIMGEITRMILSAGSQASPALPSVSHYESEYVRMVGSGGLRKRPRDSNFPN
jgi:hypothetical protein